MRRATPRTTPTAIAAIMPADRLFSEFPEAIGEDVAANVGAVMKVNDKGIAGEDVANKIPVWMKC